MDILADANIWISSRLFTSSIGAAVTCYLSRTHGRLRLPEVTAREITKIARKAAREANAKIDQAVATVNRFTFELRQDEVEDDDVVVAVNKRLADLAPHIIHVPVALDYVNAALDRVIEERAPSAQKEQFRDALFWEVAVARAASGGVDVVTNDNDFYAPGETLPRRPAQAVAADLARFAGKLRLHADLPALLQTLKQEVPGPDHDKVANLLDSLLEDDIGFQAKHNGWVIGPLQESRISAFPTARRGEVAVAFELVYPATREDEDGREIGTRVTAIGSCNIDKAGRQYSNVGLTRLEFARSRTTLPLTILYRSSKAPAG